MNLPVKSMKIKIREFFANGDNKLIFAMFFPILIEQLILVMMGTVHSLMLARVRENAEYIVSAVSLVEQINQLAYALLSSASLGATVIVSQYIGAGKIPEAKRTAEQAVTLGFVLALAITMVFIFFGEEIFNLFLIKENIEPATYKYAMQYMQWSVLSYPLLNIGNTAAGIIRGAGDAKSPMRISIAIGIINAAVAGLLIYAFDLNVTGAGIASIAARFFGAVIAIRLLVKKGFITNFANLFRVKFLYIKQIMRIGIFQSVESLIFQFGRTLTYRYFVNGDIDIAANSVTGSIFNIVCAPGNSMSIVAMTLVGRLTGAGEKKLSYKVLRNIIFISMALLLLTCLVMLPLSPVFVTLYTGNFANNLDTIKDFIYQLIFMNLIFMPTMWSASFVLFAGMKGAGDVRFTTIVSMASMWLVRVLFAYILGDMLGMGVIGVWLGMFCDWIFRGIFAVMRFRSKKWQEKSAI